VKKTNYLGTWHKTAKLPGRFLFEIQIGVERIGEQKKEKIRAAAFSPLQKREFVNEKRSNGGGEWRSRGEGDQR